MNLSFGFLNAVWVPLLGKKLISHPYDVMVRVRGILVHTCGWIASNTPREVDGRSWRHRSSTATLARAGGTLYGVAGVVLGILGHGQAISGWFFLTLLINSSLEQLIFDEESL